MKEVLQLIQERQSLRIPFDLERPIAKQDLRQILEAGRWAPTAHNMQNFEMIIVDDKRLLEAMGNITVPISDAFIRESYQQLSFSEEELLRKKVGLLSTTLRPAVRTPEAKLGESINEKALRFFGRPVIIVVYDSNKRAPASEGDFLGIMSLGCVMENMWLMAYSMGIGFQIVLSLRSELVEKEVKSILKIPEYLKIAFAFRLGYPISAPTKSLRVRRDVEDFTHYNQFGNKGHD